MWPDRSRYSFRAVVESDLALLGSWLKSAEVAKWYPDPEYIDDLEDHIEDSRIRMSLVMFDDTAFAYVHDYDIHGWPDHPLSFLPMGSRGLDTFIGEPTMLGCGHGPAYLGLTAKHLFESGAPAIGIDPDPQNTRAIRAYRKVGFSGRRIVDSEWGRVLLLSLKSPSLR